MAEKKTTFDVAVGQIVTRQFLNAEYGGGIQGGILTPAGKKFIFIFSDPAVTDNHGYNYDGWITDDQTVFDYTGRGSTGDQDFSAGNKSILESSETGAEIHLFLAEGTVGRTQQKTHRYVGRFTTDPVHGWRYEESKGTDGHRRQVIVFTLVRADESQEPDPRGNSHRVPPPPGTEITREVPAEQTRAVLVHRKETAAMQVERKERQIEDKLRAEIKAEFRLAIRPPGSNNTLYTDVWEPDDRILFEVKGSSSRQNIRMAVGQLLDYRRYIEEPEVQCVVVAPDLPEDNVIDFVHSIGMEIWTWDENDRLARSQEVTIRDAGRTTLEPLERHVREP